MKWVLLAIVVFLATTYARRFLLGGGPLLGAPKREREKLRFDPYAVLGVERSASADEISQAYREQMKRYHPDRVADLGEELQRVAHRKTLEIQRAYDELTK